MNNVVVLYHKNCMDGFSAAWAAWKHFGNEAEYIPVAHQADPPDHLESKIVYFVDFAYPKDTLQKIIDQNEKVTVIDHHKTAESYVDIADDHFFDLEHSGAVLSWKYFHPDKPTPKLLKYVEDMDLWNFNIKHTKEVIACLEIQEREFPNWSKLANDFENEGSFKKHLQAGELLLRQKNKLVSQIGAKADLVKFEGHKTLAVNSPIFASELGHHLYEKYPPIAIVWHESREGVKVSLRSNGEVNVGEIAEKYGGGGHPAASGFKFSSLEDFPWEIIND